MKYDKQLEKDILSCMDKFEDVFMKPSDISGRLIEQSDYNSKNVLEFQKEVQAHLWWLVDDDKLQSHSRDGDTVHAVFRLKKSAIQKSPKVQQTTARVF